MSGNEAPHTIQLNEKGYYEVGKGIRGARTDQELVDAIIHRERNTVSWCGARCMISSVVHYSACRSVAWVILLHSKEPAQLLVYSTQDLATV